MMTLEEAIKHCKDVALSCTNKECALEHFQLLKWLQEYSNMLEKQGEQKPNNQFTPEQAAILDKHIDKFLEQKPADKVELKFKVGDWIKHNKANFIFQINKVTDNKYEFNNLDGYNHSLPIESVDKKYHLWTIQDAKDGDVLKEDSCIFIIKRMEPNEIAIVHCCLFDDGDFSLGYALSFDVSSTYPATKEQRDLLFQKMKEAGYEWDAEKKELKKIEQKPAWSVEDRSKVQRICKYLNEVKKYYADITEVKECIEWLQSLQNRVQPQPKQEWKQKNTNDLTDFENAMMHIGGSFFGENAGLDPNDTNAIKEQANLLLELVPSKEWSEEDENYKDALISLINEIKNQPLKRLEDWDCYLNWLKSLRPQNRWQPSDEQMNALDSTLQYSQVSHNSFEHLNSLFNDLKKLRKE